MSCLLLRPKHSDRDVFAVKKIMVFNRVWDSSCPREWDRWEADGRTFVIQDLAPEDEEKAVAMLVEHFIPDEALCSASNLKNEPEGVRSISDVWRRNFRQRTSLGCYTDVEGQKTLVALNACFVICEGEKDSLELEGDSCKNVFAAMDYMKTRCDPFEYLGVDKVLTALGLSVMREYRGAKLGMRLLAAREPLCRFLGVKATETTFTGPASQKLAARCGFHTLQRLSFRDLADAGLKYPRDDRLIKLMVKKYL